MINKYKDSMVTRSTYTKILWLQDWLIFKGCYLSILLNYEFYNSLKYSLIIRNTDISGMGILSE